MTKRDIYLVGQYKYMFNTMDFSKGIYEYVQWIYNIPVVIGNLYPISYSIYSEHKEGKTYNVYSVPNTADKILRKIVYDKAQVEFEKSINTRKDQNNYSYEKINIKYDGITLKSFLLNHGYFNDEDGELLGDYSRNNNYIFTEYFDKSHYRLKLSSVSEYGMGNSFVGNYSFDYYPGQLPSKLSFAQDFFGYYNGKTSNTELIPNVYFTFEDKYKQAGTAKRNVDVDYSKIGALKSITYPTKGKTEFEYENHTFKEINDINEMGMNFDLFSMDTYNITFASEQSADPDTGEVLPLNTLYQQEIEFNKDVKANIVTHIQKVLNNPENPGSWMDSFYIRLYKIDSNGNQKYLFPITMSMEYLFTQGKYLLEATRMTRTVKEGGYQDEDGSFGMTISYMDGVPYKIDNSPTSHIAGGLRIKTITHKDNNDNTLLKTNYEYEDIKDGQKYSSGILYGYPLIGESNYYFGINKFYGLIDFPFKNGSSHSVLYAKVVEESIDNNNNKIRKIYYFDNNFIVPVNDANSDVRLRTPNFKWRIGNLKEIEYYKSNNNNSFSLIRKDSIIYNQKDKYINDELGISIEPRDINLFIFGFGKTKYKYEYYPLYSDFNYEATKITKEYLDNSIINTNTTQYFYNNPNHYQPTSQTTTFPDGITSETTYQYAHEKGNQYLIYKNIIGVPLQTTTTETANGTTKIRSDIETKYPTSQSEANAKTSGLALPFEIISKDLLGISNTESTFDQYDDKGNLLQYTSKSGISTTIIWGYNKTQPIAQVVGAKYADIGSNALVAAIVAASNADVDAATEQALITALDNLRKDAAMAGYQISTYTYDPLIGVTSITPPSGIREYYHYDAANRLDKVTDVNGNILKEYQYHYKQ